MSEYSGEVRSKEGILLSKSPYPTSLVVWESSLRKQRGTVFGADAFRLDKETDVVFRRRYTSFFDYPSGRVKVNRDRETYHVFHRGVAHRQSETFNDLKNVLFVSDVQNYQTPHKLGYDLVHVLDLEVVQAGAAFRDWRVRLSDMSSMGAHNVDDSAIERFIVKKIDSMYPR